MASNTHTASLHGGSESGEGDDGVFSLATLNGTYIFTASGSLNNGAAATADILGTLTFDGLGGVIGNLTMTAVDGGQFSCNNTFTVGGTYTLPTPVSGPGLGTMILPMTTGSINFNLLVPSTEGKPRMQSSPTMVHLPSEPPSAPPRQPRWRSRAI